MIRDLQQVNSANGEEALHECENKDSNLDNEFDPFVLVGSETSAFKRDLSTSSFLEYLIAAASKEVCCELNDFLLQLLETQQLLFL